MRATRNTRGTRSNAGGSTPALFDTILFVNQGALDAYLSTSSVRNLDKRRAGTTVKSAADLAALGWPNTQSTSGVPTTLTTKGGFLGYGASQYFNYSQSDPAPTAAGSSPPVLGTYTDPATGIVCETITFPAGVGGYATSRVTLSVNDTSLPAGDYVAWWELYSDVSVPQTTVQGYVQGATSTVGNPYHTGTLVAGQWNTVVVGWTDSGSGGFNLTLYRNSDVLASPLTLKLRRRVMARVPSYAAYPTAVVNPTGALPDYIRTTNAAPTYGIPVEYDRRATTNLQPYSETSGRYAASGTTPPAIGTAALNGKTADTAVFTAAMATGYWGGRIERTAGGGASWSIVSGTAYAVGCRIKLSRALVGSEALNFYTTGVGGVTSALLTSANSGAFTSPNGAVLAAYGTASATGAVYQTIFVQSALSSDVTVAITEHQANPGGVLGSYLKTTATAPLYTAGTPRSQNLLSKGDLTGDSYDGAGTTNTDNADGYRRITVSSSGTWKAWYRAAGPLLSQYSGCVYTTRIAIKAGNNTGAAISLWNGSAENILSAKIVSGPGNIASDSSRCYLTNLSPSTETVVQVSGVYGAPLIYVSSVPANSQTIGDYILFRQCALWEGTADLSYLDTTGLAYSEYPQLQIVHEIAATNLVKGSASQWTARGTATKTDASDTQLGLILQLRGLGGIGANDVYQAVSGLTVSAACQPAFWLSFKGGSGTLIVGDPTAGNGTWGIDTSKLPPYPVFISRNSPYISVSTEFVANGSGANGLHFYRSTGGATIDVDIAMPTLYSAANADAPVRGIPTTTASVARTATQVMPPIGYVSDAGQMIAWGGVVLNLTGGVDKVLLGRPNGYALYVDGSYVDRANIWDATTYAVTANSTAAGVPMTAASTYAPGAKLKVAMNGGAVAQSASNYDSSMGTGNPGLGHNGSGGAVLRGGSYFLKIGPPAANDTILQSASTNLS